MTAITDQTNPTASPGNPSTDQTHDLASSSAGSGGLDPSDPSFDASQFALPIDAAPRSDRGWRILGLAAMFCAVVLLGWNLYSGMDSTPGRSSSADASVEPVRIEVSNFGVEAGMLARPISGGDQALITAAGTFDAVMVPTGQATIVGLYRPNGSLIGLTTVDSSQADSAIDGTRITPRTTAQTLVSLFPGIAQRDRVEVDRRISEATILPPFKDLERAILDGTNLLAEDQNLEFALGSTVGELLPRDIADPQCTTSGLSLAGVCISAGASGLDISNQLTRWALLFDSEDAARLCAAVPPMPATLTLTDTGSCSSRLHLVAPGPFSADRMLPGGLSEGQVQIAAGVTAFSSWSVPVADAIYGTQANTGSGAVQRIAAATSMINTNFRTSIDGDATLERLALDLGDPSASSRQRATATVGLGRAMMEDSRIANDLLGDRVIGDNDGTRLLDLIARAVDWVPADAPMPFWQSSPTAEVDLTRFIGTGS